MALPSYYPPPCTCAKCGKQFQPKRGGHNAKFCSKVCKQRVRTTRPYNAGVRKLTFLRTMSSPNSAAGHLASGRKSRNRVRDWLANYKLSNGCADCGYAAHYAALQLDHEGQKTDAIVDCRSSIARLQKEIADGKCVVRCANCHSVKTWADKNKLQYHPTMSAHQDHIKHEVVDTESVSVQ